MANNNNVIGQFQDEMEQTGEEVVRDVKDSVGQALEQGVQSVVGTPLTQQQIQQKQQDEQKKIIEARRKISFWQKTDQEQKNIRMQEKQKKMIQLEKAKKEAEVIRSKLANLSLTIPVLTQEQDSLYGSITAADLARALKEEGIEIDRKKIVLAEPIKRLGSYTVGVKIHPEMTAQLNITVASE